MNIALGVGLNAAGKRGIDYYMANLVEALGEIDSSNRYVLLSYFYKDHEAKKALLPDNGRPNFERVVPRWPERLVNALEDAGVPVIDRVFLAGRNLDVFHALGARLPRLRRAKAVTTVYDTAAEVFHERTPGYRPGVVADPASRDRALRSDRIIAVSEATKRDLMRFYGVPEEKIEVITTGVNLRRFRSGLDPVEAARARARYGLPARYFMLLGPFEPRRNAESAIRAFAAIRGEAALAGCGLALVGSAGPYRDGLVELARSLGAGDRVACSGYVPGEDMAAVFGGALALAHPTGFEGFGTVSLEAMACGTPVITSDIPAVREAVGDAALTVPPGDVDALARAMRELAASEALRLDLRAKGLERARLFSYDAIAKKTLALYERVGRA